MRLDRNNDEIRIVNIHRNYLKHPEGSVLIEMGDTKIIVTATIEERVPRWLYRSGNGWLSGEYSMLPGSTGSRKQRESRTYPDGRNIEISRLIGRALRSVIDLTVIGERTIWIDCDVIQADGGTRCAAITGGFVALFDCVYKLYKRENLESFPINQFIAAISVGKVDGEILLDLDYLEDSRAEVDANIIMTDSGEYVELQASGEDGVFNNDELMEILKYSNNGIINLIHDQKYALKDVLEELENEEITFGN